MSIAALIAIIFVLVVGLVLAIVLPLTLTKKKTASDPSCLEVYQAAGCSSDIDYVRSLHGIEKYCSMQDLQSPAVAQSASSFLAECADYTELDCNSVWSALSSQDCASGLAAWVAGFCQFSNAQYETKCDAADAPTFSQARFNCMQALQGASCEDLDDFARRAHAIDYACGTFLSSTSSQYDVSVNAAVTTWQQGACGAFLSSNQTSSQCDYMFDQLAAVGNEADCVGGAGSFVNYVAGLNDMLGTCSDYTSEQITGKCPAE